MGNWDYESSAFVVRKTFIATWAYHAKPVPVPVNGLASGVQAISAGSVHTCAVANGAAFCWGDNSAGELGNGTKTNSNVPVPVTGLTSGVQAISVASTTSCAVVNGEAFCWGKNNIGQLGNNSTTDSLVPIQVGLP